MYLAKNICNARDWYCVDKDQQKIGPMSGEALLLLARLRELNGDTLVWCEALSGWEKFSRIFNENKVIPANWFMIAWPAIANFIGVFVFIWIAQEPRNKGFGITMAVVGFVAGILFSIQIVNEYKERKLAAARLRELGTTGNR